MTVDQAKLRRLCATPPSSIEVSHARAIAGRVPELLDELDAADQRIADLTARLATAHDMIRHFEQERDAWPAAYRQRAAKTDARIKELEALRDQLFRQRAQTRDIIHALPSVMLAAIADRCRGSTLPCFCGCHVSQADSLLPSEET